MKKRGLKHCFTSSQVVLSMIMVQGFVTGMQLLSRVILVQGSFIFSLIAYRHIVAAICVAPFALYFERDRTLTFTPKVWFWLFVNALMGMTLAQGLFYYGLRDTSATYSVNFLNMVPICTFLTSVICRFEKLGLHTWAGRTKCAGAILCVGGALLTTLYKGKQFYLHHHTHHAQTAVAAHPTHMLQGTFLLICSCFSYTAWFLVQVQLLKVFPLRYWGTMLSCVIAAIQSGIAGVCIDSSKAAWRLEWNLQLLTIIYSGALATAATFCILSWAVAIKGPTYPPMFNPLSLIFVAFLEAFILGQPLTFGTLLGMVLIMVGLYSFLWGKSNEKKGMTQQPIVAAAEVSNVTDLIAGPESTATVVPSSSPLNTITLVSETPYKN
ncbi:WAT1-related protein At1g44800-like [Vigna unguiculata]|uniref:WAT1-related protein At1g44800-like n=1 Tax=Vigna unguiculata TaxID=3917 RepID=UPI001015F65A|nr:WAT1-related protein At1g44800-like [Vigna unguiculata]